MMSTEISGGFLTGGFTTDGLPTLLAHSTAFLSKDAGNSSRMANHLPRTADQREGGRYHCIPN
jgi:hypothetical protein